MLSTFPMLAAARFAVIALDNRRVCVCAADVQRSRGNTAAAQPHPSSRADPAQDVPGTLSHLHPDPNPEANPYPDR